MHINYELELKYTYNLRLVLPGQLENVSWFPLSYHPNLILYHDTTEDILNFAKVLCGEADNETVIQAFVDGYVTNCKLHWGRDTVYLTIPTNLREDAQDYGTSHDWEDITIT